MTADQWQIAATFYYGVTQDLQQQLVGWQIATAVACFAAAALLLLALAAGLQIDALRQQLAEQAQALEQYARIQTTVADGQTRMQTIADETIMAMARRARRAS